ncbi:MAG: hypothetical protein HC944_01520 [Nanoarchaeota archaeon]|nr:hypothetical protein [Nanoarchaeota archaeon]
MFQIKKRNKITLMVITALCLTIQSSAFASDDSSAFDLKISETVDVDSDFQIKLLNILDDSRCPLDVTCIWEGTVSAEISIVKDGQSRGKYVIPLGLHDLVEPQAFDDVFIMLSDVKPYPVSTQNIISSDYVATLVVSQIKQP